MKKYICMLVLLCLVGSVGCNDDTNKPRIIICEDTIVGKLISVPNPYLEKPCLPGIVAAIKTDSLTYIISMHGEWFWNEDEVIVINGDSLIFNNSYGLFGSISKKRDIYSNDFYEIEVVDVVNFDKISQ